MHAEGCTWRGARLWGACAPTHGVCTRVVFVLPLRGCARVCAVLQLQCVCARMCMLCVCQQSTPVAAALLQRGACVFKGGGGCAHACAPVELHVRVCKFAREKVHGKAHMKAWLH